MIFEKNEPKFSSDCFLTGVVNAPYNDIGSFNPIANAADCQLKCQANPDCNYFVYRSDLHGCWLKSQIGSYGFTPCSVCTLGPKMCIVS